MGYIFLLILSFLSGGTIGSLITIYVKWGIEKKRDKRNARRDLIANARSYIESKSFSGFSFYQTDQFLRLEPCLKKGVIDFVKKYEMYYDNIDYVDQDQNPDRLKEDFKVSLLEEFRRLEKKWGLI